MEEQHHRGRAEMMTPLEKLKFFEEYTIKPLRNFIEKELSKIAKVKIKLVNPTEDDLK